jgi:hypothetical protein
MGAFEYRQAEEIRGGFERHGVPEPIHRREEGLHLWHVFVADPAAGTGLREQRLDLGPDGLGGRATHLGQLRRPMSLHQQS